MPISAPWKENAHMPGTIVIVGGVAGGASAAARLRRLDEDAEIIILERGGYISFANCGLPYYLGGVIKRRENLLLQTPESMFERFRIDVRVHSEVTAVNAQEKKITIHHLPDGKTYTLQYDKLILSPGAAPVRPPVPGVNMPGVFTLRNLEDCDNIKEYLINVKPQTALVAGVGLIGIEMIENFVLMGITTTAVDIAPQVLSQLDSEIAVVIQRHIESKGVAVRLGLGLAGIEKNIDGRLLCRLSNNEAVIADIVLLSAGVRPDSAPARSAGLALDARGAIRVDERMRTSDPHIHAVGDAVSVRDFVTGRHAPVPMAGPANRQGRIVADILAGRDGHYGGTQGTMVCKVFDYTAGCTGSNERMLNNAGIAYDKVYLHPASHASYYPDPHPLSVKLLFSPADGRILGAQAVGREGVDKRIDIFAVALRAGMSVYDLAALELSYAPPYSSAKDPVNMAGFIAVNVLNADLKQIFIEDLAGLHPESDFLADVRTPKEYIRGSIPGATNIPLDTMRDRLDEFPKNKRIILFCQVGLRGYIAYRILCRHGFDNVVNLSGGYQSWQPVYGSS
jgi:NADPH-dependent 2,4-dienoyl-CoA reductase/sulfur reductase-like enzyme/rhodanese-related sulfurtransferase